jgi:ribosomal protein L20
VPEGQRLRRNRRANYSNMSTATHQKTVGYNSLMRGKASIKAVTTAYVNIAFDISEFNKPRQDAVTHIILSQYVGRMENKRKLKTLWILNNEESNES